MVCDKGGGNKPTNNIDWPNEAKTMIKTLGHEDFILVYKMSCKGFKPHQINHKEVETIKNLI